MDTWVMWREDQPLGPRGRTRFGVDSPAGERLASWSMHDGREIPVVFSPAFCDWASLTMPIDRDVIDRIGRSAAAYEEAWGEFLPDPRPVRVPSMRVDLERAQLAIERGLIR